MKSQSQKPNPVSGNPPLPKVIVLCGPTGVGKTATALSLAKGLSAEIVNADSMQVYRFMDIGTAKPTAEERKAVRHHLVDVLDPDAPFSAAAYAAAARNVIETLHQNGIVPIIVGGTGLYVKALLYGLFKEAPKDPTLRTRLRAEMAASGIGPMHARLQSLDPDAARRIHPNDAYRILRALETHASTHVPLSQHHAAHRFACPAYDALKIGLTLEREALYDRINRRVDQMLVGGFLGEVQFLLGRGYSPRLKSMQAIGYRHMVRFLEGKLSWEDAVATLKRDTRRYAKRQWTWFRADPDMLWTSPESISTLEGAIDSHLKR